METGPADDPAIAERPERSGERPVVYFHVGAPKTGTTLLQNVLWRNRNILRRDGVLYPGNTFRAHFWAALDLRKHSYQGFDDPEVPGAWERLVDEARGWNGTVILSHELFSPATAEQVEQAMAALSFAEVHLIYTARDLGRQIPAVWQENIKNRGIQKFGEFLETLHAPPGSMPWPAEVFWRTQDAVGVLDRWARTIPPHRVHVVTIPPPGVGSSLLWERFAGVVGLDPARYELADVRSNFSLGAAEVTLLRRVNSKVGRRVTWPMYRDLVKIRLAQQVLAGRPDPIKIMLAPGDHAWSVVRAKELVDGLRGAGYDVAGDLDELIPAPYSAMEHQPVDEVPAELQLEAAVDAIAGLMPYVSSPRRGERQLRDRVRELESELARRQRQPVRTVMRDTAARHAMVRRAVAAMRSVGRRIKADR